MIAARPESARIEGRASDLIQEPIQVLFLDVDGVLADGGIWLAEGLELKRFAARDGAGAFLAHRAGLKLMLVTFRESEAVKRRAAELGIEALQGVREKGPAVQAALLTLHLPATAAAFMGDDLVDLEAMRNVGLAIAPRDAAPAALRLADVVTSATGGQGAVREAIEILLWLNQSASERGSATKARASRTRRGGGTRAARRAG